MTRLEAIDKYFKHNPKAIQMIERIQNWDGSLGLLKNTVKGNFNSTSCAVHFAHKFELEHNTKKGRPKKEELKK